jgi:lipid-binding SYLF domain-containing protein
VVVTPAAAAPPPAPAKTLESAIEVLDELAAIPLKCIPPAILSDAQGVVIVPRVIKAGFVFAGRGGHGVVLTRDRAGAWSGPTFVDLGGVSVGLQAGVESADVVLVFKTRKSLDRILEGKGKLTLGADAAIAAGPVGRQAEAGTDARLRAEIVSYSRSRGVFAGVALDGAALVFDHHANEAYACDKRPETVKHVETLLIRLTEMSTDGPKAGAGRPRLDPPAPPIKP